MKNTTMTTNNQTTTNVSLNLQTNFDNLFDSMTNKAIEMLPSESIAGIDTTFYQYEETTKDDSGKEIIVRKKVTNPVLVNNIVKIQSIDLFSKYSSTKLAFCLADFTKEQAEMYNCKTIIDLVYKMIPTLGIDRTTASKYRKVGIWATIVTDDGKRQFRNGIDSDVSINTLDRCTSLVSVNAKGEKVDLEKCNSDELTELFNNFYQKYIISGRIWLNASQSKVKEQISSIVNENKKVVKIIENENKKDSDNSDNSTTSDTQNTELANNSDEGTNENVNNQTIVNDEENIQKSAEEHINLLKTIFKDNKNAINLLSKLLKEVVNLK